MLRHSSLSYFLGFTLGFYFAAVETKADYVVFSDKSTFLSSTAATSATGALPDLGFIGGLGSSNTVGSVTFRSPGSSFYIGAAGVGGGVPGDWYGPLAGNDIAMGGPENIDVETASSVFSLGFDFAEPNLTMPSYGGSPVDSTFTVTLFSGSSTVSAFTFNAPDDLPSFIGVWSDTAFNRAEIRETLGSDDDEYFGEFYSGSTPLPAVPEASTLGIAAYGVLCLFSYRLRRIDIVT